jgi:hypothetical protein
MAVLPAVHRDAAPTAQPERADAEGSGPPEPAPSERPTPVHLPAVDAPVRPTVARPRVRSAPPPRAPAPGAGSSRVFALAAGGAALLVIVVAGYLIGHGASNSNTTSPTAHTGTSASSGSAKAGATTSHTTAAAPATRTFTGREFSITYPAGWMIETNEKPYPWGTDTTVVSPGDGRTLLRVDVSPNVKTSDPLTASQPEINRVSKQPGYQQLALASNTVNGNRGERWEFLVSDNGVVEHSVDEFIIAPNGDGLAILTQAPASKYPSLAKEFTALRQTIAVHSS